MAHWLSDGLSPNQPWLNIAQTHKASVRGHSVEIAPVFQKKNNIHVGVVGTS